MNAIGDVADVAQPPASCRRVLHVTEATEAGVAAFIETAARLDPRCTVLLLRWRTPADHLEATLRGAGIPVTTLPLAKAWRHLPEIRRLVRSHEILMLHSGIAGIVGRTATVARLVRPRTLVYAPHMSVGYLGRGWALVERLLSRAVRPQHFLFVSESERSGFAEKFGRGVLAKSSIVYPWIAETVRAIERDQPTQANLRLITIGRLSPQKAPARVATLINTLNASGINVEFLWVGDGPLRSSFMKALSSQVAARVQVSGWVRDVNDVVAAWRPHFYVNLSIREGFSIAAMEAMAMGLPAFVSRVTGNDELVVDGKNGLFVDSDGQPSEKFVDRVRESMEPTAYEQLCTGALETGRRFDRRLFAESYDALLSAAVSHRPRSGCN